MEVGLACCVYFSTGLEGVCLGAFLYSKGYAVVFRLKVMVLCLYRSLGDKVCPPQGAGYVFSILLH